MDDRSAEGEERGARKRVWLHIGTHKTGTTSIQRTAANAEALLATQGVLYPKAGRPLVESVSSGHHLLPWSLNKRVLGPSYWPEGHADISKVWRDLRDEIDSTDAKNVLISSEEFDTLGVEHVNAIAGALDGYDVHVMCFLRRVDLFVQAMYTTDILQGHASSDIFAYAEGMRTPTDYASLIARWRAAFGRDAVHVLPYRADFDRNWSVLGALFTYLECDQETIIQLEEASEARTENVSAPWHVIESIRALRNMGLPQALVEDFTTAQLVIQNRTRTWHDIIPPTLRAAMLRGGFPQLTSALSSPLEADEATFFRGDELDQSDDKWLETHQKGSALAESFWRMREFAEAKSGAVELNSDGEWMFTQRERPVVDFLPKHFRKDLPPAPYFWNLDSINITDRVALVGWALPFGGKPENVQVLINDVPAPDVQLSAEPILGRDYPWWPNASLSRFGVSMELDALGARWRDHKELRIEVRPREEDEGAPATFDEAPVMYYQQADDLAQAPSPELLQTIGCVTIQQFLLGGRTLYHRFQNALHAETGRTFADAGHVLDWGCGPGRIALHVRRDIKERGSFTGIDIVEESVAYANAALGQYFRVCETTPPLPVGDGSVDVIYAYSVLTHIPGPMLRGWLEELARVMKPGAVALVTTLGELAFVRFRPYANAGAYEAWRANGVSDESLNADLVNTKVPQDYYRNTLISTGHFTKLCDGLFEVRRKISNFYFYQDLFVLRRL